MNGGRPIVPPEPEPLYIDMGLPSGTLWATRNFDLRQPDWFAKSPFQYECSYFSWGNIDGHNPSSKSAFDYNFGGVNQAEPWYEGQPYGSTPGNTLTGNIPVGDEFDAARFYLGVPWRMPSSVEFNELFANIRYIKADGTEVDTTKTDKRVTVNGVMGLYIESRINGARMFFSCSGYGLGRSLYDRGSNGSYWSSTWFSARSARYMYLGSGGVSPQGSDYRYVGFALRPVQSGSVALSNRIMSDDIQSSLESETKILDEHLEGNTVISSQERFLDIDNNEL